MRKHAITSSEYCKFFYCSGAEDARDWFPVLLRRSSLNISHGVYVEVELHYALRVTCLPDNFDFRILMHCIDTFVGNVHMKAERVQVNNSFSIGLFSLQNVFTSLTLSDLRMLYDHVCF